MDFAARLHAAINRATDEDPRIVVERLHAEVERGLVERHLDGEAGPAALAHVIAENIASGPFAAHLAIVIYEYFHAEQLFALPSIYWDDPPTYAALWQLRAKLESQRNFLDHFDEHCALVEQLFAALLEPILANLPRSSGGADNGGLAIPLEATIPDFSAFLERVVRIPFAEDFDDTGLCVELRHQLERNLILASGGNPTQPVANTAFRFPTRAGTSDPAELVATYLDRTPLRHLARYDVPFAIPDETRFEHHWIVGGSGHGKTQTLQYLIAKDIEKVLAGEASLVVVDSQGDLIENIKRLRCFAPEPLHSCPVRVGDLVQVTIGEFDQYKNGVRVRDVHDGFVFVEGSEAGVPLSDVSTLERSHESRLVLIDPSDIEFPVALNLFDAGMERINRYAPLERERLINGIIELYDFVLGSLLSAELTQKQSVIFRYITRLMLHIPNATIHTLRELMEPEGYERYEEHIHKLKGTARAFFETEFRDKSFADTKKQVLRRLWGILENQTFERMFSHPRNKLDLFSELNKGKVILVNTAKDLLKQNGCEVLGRFFIAMIAQAAQERATLPKKKRVPTFVYIDECQDYLDQNVSLILEQARKYRIGLVLANQYVSQLEPRLQASFDANTAIKFAGGVSSKDARSFAAMMRCKPELIEAQPKGSFAAYVRNVTAGAVPLKVPFGVLEAQEQMNDGQFRELRNHMRRAYATPYQDIETAAAPSVDPDDQGSDPSANW